MDRANRRWRGAIAGGEERSQVEQVEGSERKWREAIAGAGLQVEGIDRR